MCASFVISDRPATVCFLFEDGTTSPWAHYIRQDGLSAALLRMDDSIFADDVTLTTPMVLRQCGSQCDDDSLVNSLFCGAVAAWQTLRDIASS
eukprot:scaffold134489_cov31-Prasinocladus_malaysianus.AAC.2